MLAAGLGVSPAFGAGEHNAKPAKTTRTKKADPVAVVVAVQEPQAAQALYQRGLQLEQEKDYAPAIDAFSEAIRLDVALDSAMLHRALSYWRSGDEAHAAADIGAYLAINSGNIQAKEAIAVALRRGELVLAEFAPYGLSRQGRFYRNGPSTNVLAALSRPDPTQIDKNDAGKATLDSSNLDIVPIEQDTAESARPEPVIEPPAFTPPSAEPPVVAADLRIPENAVSETNRGLDPPPIAPAPSAKEDATYYLRLARFYAGKEDFEKAVKSYDDAVRLNPDLSQALNGRGYAYLRLREAVHATADFSEAIRLNPNYLNAYQNRAMARRMAGDRDGAAEDDRQARELAGSH